MNHTYYPQNVCSKRIDIVLENGIIQDMQIASGCNGNLKGIVQLVKGQSAMEVIRRLRGVRCGNNFTSCPDQIAIALTEALEAEGGGVNG